jgi:hypothetical protein
MPKAITYPFQASPQQLTKHIEEYINVTVGTLSSFYLELPSGEHFVKYARFQTAYDQLKAATRAFATLDRKLILEAARKDALVIVVLRCMVGLSPPEVADICTETQQVPVTQGFARGVDQRAREGADLFGRARPETVRRLTAVIEAMCSAIERGATPTTPLVLHRLDKIDTVRGLDSLRQAARQGVDYSALLYERLLGRPFASHRDSVSEMIGDIVESQVIATLSAAHVPFHKTGRAEKISGFDQAPDFLVPDLKAPKVVIEAKLTQDDGTARDKVTRVQHLGTLSKGG